MPVSRHRRRRGRAAPRGSAAAASLSLARPRRKKTNKLYLAAAVTIAVLVIGSFGLSSIPFGGGGSGVRTGTSEQFVDGIGVQQAITENNHVLTGQTVDYASFPPTSGDNWPPGEQARCGFHEDGFRDERAVHNLEHSNIVVSYNFIDPAQVAQLRQAVGNIGLANVWGLTRFYDNLPEGQVALTAWGIIDTMDGIDPDRIERFFEAYAGSIGPERVPCL